MKIIIVTFKTFIIYALNVFAHISNICYMTAQEAIIFIWSREWLCVSGRTCLNMVIGFHPRQIIVTQCVLYNGNENLSDYTLLSLLLNARCCEVWSVN